MIRELTDLITGIQNTAFCQINEIQPEQPTSLTAIHARPGSVWQGVWTVGTWKGNKGIEVEEEGEAEEEKGRGEEEEDGGGGGEYDDNDDEEEKEDGG